MTSLAVNWEQARKAAGLVMGVRRDDPDLWTTQEREDYDLIRRSGLLKFYSAYEWSFLNQLLTITTNEPYSTGTVTIVNGAVTLASGTWPTWATDAWLTVEGVRYTVESRDSGTALTLADDEIDAAALTEYTLERYQYDLPSNFGGLLGDLTFDPEERVTPEVVKSAQWEQIRASQQYVLERNSPRYYDVYPLALDTAVGQEWKIMFDPVPDAVYRLMARYRAQMEDMDENAPYPAGGSIHAKTILEAILSEAESFYHDNPQGSHAIAYERALMQSVNYDREHSSPHQLPRRIRDNYQWRGTMAQQRVTFNG